MKKQRKTSIRVYITVILTACVLVSMLAIRVFLIPQFKAIVKSETQNHLDDSVTSYSSNVQQVVMNLRMQLEMIARTDRVHPGHDEHESKGIEENAKEMLEQEKEIKKISVIDNKGVVSYSTDSSMVKANLLSVEGVEEALTTGKYSIKAASTEKGSFENTTLTMIVPLHEKGETTGAVVAELKGSFFLSTVENMSFTGIPEPRAYLLDENGLIFCHVNEESVGAVVADINTVVQTALERIKKNSVEGTAINGTYFHEMGNVYVSCITIPGVNWTLAVNVLESKVFSNLAQIQNLFTVFAVIIVIVMMILAFYVSHIITKPISYVAEKIGYMATLDFRYDKKATELKKLQHRKDEVGTMIAALGQMIAAIKDQLVKVNESSSQIVATSKELQQASNEVNSHAEETSALTEQISASMQETTASTELITSDIQAVTARVGDINNQVTEGTNRTNEIMLRAQGLQEKAQTSQEKTKALFKDVKEKSEIALVQSKSVDKINELANAIMEIASQTSLLALNASIEAARAGEAGKGFAVVASEISSLATQSSETVANITEIVAEVNQAVKNMSECLEMSQTFVEGTVLNDYNTFLDVIHNYNDDASEIHEMIQVIDRNTNKLVQNIENISKSISSINGVITDSAISVNDITKRNIEIVQLSAKTYEMVEKNADFVSELDNVVNAFQVGEIAEADPTEEEETN